MASRVEQKQQARAQRLAAEEAERRDQRRRSQLMRLGLVVGLAIVVVIVAIVVSGGGGSGSTNAKTTPAASNALFKGIPQHGLTLGDAKAKATLIEFADLQCPYCAQYNNQALPTVVNKYVRAGKLRYQLHFRSFLGPDSVKAAGAAAVASQENRLYQFADLFYHRQGEENSGYVTPAFIRGIASGAGVDPSKAAAAAANPKGQPLVAQAEKLASQLGSSSTPSFYLRLASGRLVPVNPQALDGQAMSQAIDAALKQ